MPPTLIVFVEYDGMVTVASWPETASELGIIELMEKVCDVFRRSKKDSYDAKPVTVNVMMWDGSQYDNKMTFKA